MYPLFETIRILDGRPQHLEWHQERLERSFYAHFNTATSLRLDAILRVPEKFSRDAVKCRFLYGDGGYRPEFERYVPRKIQSLKLVEAGGLDYSLKYTDRNAINALLKEKDRCDDILICKHGMITDTSYTNVVLFNGERWVTPLHPLLEGTCRNRLVAEGRILEMELHLDDLPRFHSFKLINAMLDFDEQVSLKTERIIS